MTGMVGAAAWSPAVAQRQERTIPTALLGAWDLTVGGDKSGYPSWLGVYKSGNNTLVGSFVGRGGSARPVSEVKYEGERFNFTLPKQWERGPEDIKVEGQLLNGKLTGRYGDENGKWTEFTGERAPDLRRSSPPTWGQTVELFNGKDTSGWKARRGEGVGGWVVEDGLLRNAKPGIDLVTERKFDDFKLHVEFRYPKGSNSGIYLRGRYEAQIEDNYGRPADSHYIGGIYGFLTPRENVAKPADEWQTMDITLVGRILTLALNGDPVIERQAIPGITGGALDSKEGEPGPIMLQGDHGKVDFRKVTITPAR
jgi:hypothetical protein